MVVTNLAPQHRQERQEAKALIAAPVGRFGRLDILVNNAGLQHVAPIQKVLLARQAVKRLLEPEEVAELAVFLCIDSASGITGTHIPIDLGWTAH